MHARVCVCVYTCVWVHVSVCVYTCVWVHVSVCLCKHTRMSVAVFTCSLTNLQHTSVSQGRSAQIIVRSATQRYKLQIDLGCFLQSQYTDMRPTSPATDPAMPGAWQGCQPGYQSLIHWYDLTWKKPYRKSWFDDEFAALEAYTLPLGHQDSMYKCTHVCLCMHVQCM